MRARPRCRWLVAGGDKYVSSGGWRWRGGALYCNRSGVSAVIAEWLHRLLVGARSALRIPAVDLPNCLRRRRRRYSVKSPSNCKASIKTAASHLSVHQTVEYECESRDCCMRYMVWCVNTPDWCENNKWQPTFTPSEEWRQWRWQGMFTFGSGLSTRWILLGTLCVRVYNFESNKLAKFNIHIWTKCNSMGKIINHKVLTRQCEECFRTVMGWVLTETVERYADINEELIIPDVFHFCILIWPWWSRWWSACFTSERSIPVSANTKHICLGLFHSQFVLLEWYPTPDR